MANDTTIHIGLQVDGADKAITSIGGLKKALKDATSAQLEANEAFGIGSKQFIDASKRVSDLKDKMDDLKDASKGLQGTGIERATAGFKSLGEGFLNLDFDKVKIGLTGIKSALASTGILLVVAAVGYLADKFDVFGKIAKVVTDIVYKFTDAIGLTSKATEAALDKQNEAYKKQAEVVGERYDREIALAKAAGKETYDLEQAKEQTVELFLNKQKDALDKLKKSKGELNTDEKKDYDDLQKALLDSSNKRKELELAKDKEIHAAFQDLQKQYDAIDNSLADAKLSSDSQRQKATIDRDLQTAIKALNDKQSKTQDLSEAGFVKADAEEKKLIEKANLDKAAIDDKVNQDRLKKTVDRLTAEAQIRLDYSNGDIAAQQRYLDDVYAAQKKNTTDRKLLDAEYYKNSKALQDKADTDTQAFYAKVIADGKAAAAAQLADNKDKAQVDYNNSSKSFQDQRDLAQANYDADIQAEGLTDNKKLLLAQKLSDDKAKINAAEDKANKARFDNAFTQTSSALDNINGAYTNAGATIVQSIGGAFDILTDKSASVSTKIAAGLDAIASSLNAIDQAQEESANLQIKNITAKYQTQFNQMDAAQKKELSVTGLSAAQTDAINKKYALKKYALQLEEYNKENEIKKKAFETNKKLSIASTIIATLAGAISAFNSFAVIPVVGTILGAVAAAGVVALGAIQVAQISSTQFDSGTPPTAPDTSDVTPQQAPDYSTGQNSDKTVSSSDPSSGGKLTAAQPTVIKAVVVESDITSSQQKIKAIQDRSSL